MKPVLHATLDDVPFTVALDGQVGGSLEPELATAVVHELTRERDHHVPRWDWFVRVLGERFKNRLVVLGIDKGNGVEPFTPTPPLRSGQLS